MQGVWGADCAAPFVAFKGGTIQMFADKATYPLKAAALNGPNLQVEYDTPQGKIAETYVLDGETLRLDRGTYSGTEAVWHKQPMRKCG